MKHGYVYKFTRQLCAIVYNCLFQIICPFHFKRLNDFRKE